MRLRLAALVVIACLSLAAAARADGVEVTQEIFDDDGWPRLVANYRPDGSRAVPSWRICAPDCGPVVATDRPYSAGPTPAGTTFEASATLDGVTTTDRSRVWNGRVANLTPPMFIGEPVVGQALTAQPGSWTGGWGDDDSLVEIRACPTPAAEDCRRIQAPSFPGLVPYPVVIGKAYAGWYVGALDKRNAAQLSYTLLLPSFPAGQVSGIRAPAPGPTVAVGALRGPVTDPNAVAPVSRPPLSRPRVALKQRAVLVGTSLVLGTLDCPRRCVARVTLRRRSWTTTRRSVVRDGTAKIKLRQGSYPRRATALRVTVRFDGHAKVWRGVVKLRPRPA